MTKKPGPHPDPPVDFDSRPLPIETVDKHLIRIHKKGREAICFGCSGGNRFDAPNGEFGVLYAGEDDYCAFIETFGSETGANIVAESRLRMTSVSKIGCLRPLRLVKLRGEGLAKLRADARLSTGDHDVARKWSLAIHGHPDKVDGISYTARHDDTKVSAAIFARAEAKVDETLIIDSLRDPRHAHVVNRLLDHYDFALAP